MAELLSSLKKIQEQVNKLVQSLEEPKPKDKEPKEPKEKKPKEPKEPKDKEPKETEEKPEKVVKNIPRLTPTISKKLQEVVEEVCTWDDKFKKEFAEYANSMTKDDYAAKTLDDHIEDFAMSKRPGPSGGSGAKPAPALEITELTYKELKELKGLSNTDDPLVFRTKQGKLVTGPSELDDENMDEGKFESADILIGETTRRVYNSDEEFMGWWGFGKFKDADM